MDAAAPNMHTVGFVPGVGFFNEIPKNATIGLNGRHPEDFSLSASPNRQFVLCSMSFNALGACSMLNMTIKGALAHPSESEIDHVGLIEQQKSDYRFYRPLNPEPRTPHATG